MSLLVKHCYDRDGVFADSEIDSVGKALEESAADVPVDLRKLERVLGDPWQELVELGRETVAEAGLLVVVPESRLFDIKLRLRANDESASHRFWRRRCSLS